MKRERKCE